jgi:hypothetical protein
MIPATDRWTSARATCSGTVLGYPVASVAVGVARDQDGRDTTGRDEDGTAR